MEAAMAGFHATSAPATPAINPTRMSGGTMSVSLRLRKSGIRVHARIVWAFRRPDAAARGVLDPHQTLRSSESGCGLVLASDGPDSPKPAHTILAWTLTRGGQCVGSRAS